MNNFTKSSGRAYWHSITNLFCCSPHIKRLQDKSMKVAMLFMFFALGSGAMFAQNPDTGNGFLAGDIDGCMADLPAAPPVDELKARPEFKDCVTSSDPFLLEPIAVIDGVDGEWGIASGFSKGSTNCAWTYYYVYTAKCQNAIRPFTVKFNGGDATQPKLKKGAKIPQGATDLNLCYADIPPAPLTYIEMAALFTDNCSHIKAEELVTLRTKSKQDDCKWIVMYVYTVHDGCTEPIEIVVTYTGGDTENPEFTLPYKDLPHDVAVDCDNIPAPLTLFWGDNCTPSNKVKSVDDTTNLGIGCAGGFIVRTWDIKDDCGNTNSHTQKITVLPAPQAYFYDTQDVYIPCADRANAASYIQDLGYTNGRDSLRCGIYGIAKPVFTVPDTSCGDFEVTYSFTDLCGRISTASLTAHIVDIINPSILIAANDMTVECDGNGNVEEYAEWLANNGGALAEDNCDTDLTWDNDDTSHPFSDDCGATGQKMIVFTVFDDCGNESKTAATFYIVDRLNPTVVPATDKRVQCDGDGNTQQYLDWIASNGGASASDECSKITWTHNGPVLDPKDPYYDNLTDFYYYGWNEDCSFYTGYVRVTFTATDECGNYTNTIADFIIEDSIAPTISTPASDMTVECDGSIGELDYLSDAAYGTNNAAAFYDWLYTNGGAIALPDACSEIKWTYYPVAYSNNPCDVYYYVTFTVSDVCGNESTTSATFHVVDTNSPAITEEAHDMTVECDGIGNEQEFYAWLNNNAGATAIDLCDNYLDWSNDWATSKFTDECGATGRVTVLFTVTDDCGLSSTTAAEFVIVDTTAPGIYVPYDVTLDLDDNCSADITPYNTGYATGSDQCGNVTVTFADVSNKGDCVDVITRTWTVTDACGNKSVGYQYITLQDVSAPVLNPALLPPNMSSLDLCEAPVGPTEAEVAAAFTDNCNTIIVTKTLNVISVGACDWATQYIYEVKDECGNVYDGLVKISYWGSDQSAPQPTLGPLPKDVSKINECLTDAVAANPGANKYDVLALFTDNCDLKLEITKSEVIDDTDYYYYPYGCTWAFHYTFTITDDCGNYYSFNQNFSGSDNLAPRLIDPASLISLDLSDIDSCKDTAPDGPSAQYVAGLFIECGIDNGDGVIVDRTVHMTGTDCNWLYSYEYDVYDNCGNHYPSFKVTYTGSDQTAPYIESDASNKTVELDCSTTANADAFNAWLANNGSAYAYDNCSDVTWTYTTIKGGTACASTSTVTFKATDACGNYETTTAVFTVSDTTGPDATAPADIAVECTSDIPAVNTKGVTATDCSNPVVVTHVSDVSDGNFNPEVITRTYRATDACNNATDVIQIITVQDKTSPEVTCEVDQDFGDNPVLDNNDIPDAIPETASYTDNCDPDGMTSDFTDDLSSIQVGISQDIFITTDCWTIFLFLDAAPDAFGFPTWSGYWQNPTSGFNHTLTYNHNLGQWEEKENGFVIWWQVTNNNVPSCVVGDYQANPITCDPLTTVFNCNQGQGSGTEFTLVRTFTQVDASGNVGECSTTYTWTVPPTLPTSTNTGITEVGALDTAPAVAAVDSGEVSMDLDFRAYPVPFNKDVNILYNFKFDTDITVRVFDTKGILVLSKVMNGYKAGSDFTLPLSINGADQLYYVQVITNRGTITKKIVSSSINKK